MDNAGNKTVDDSYHFINRPGQSINVFVRLVDNDESLKALLSKIQDKYILTFTNTNDPQLDELSRSSKINSVVFQNDSENIELGPVDVQVQKYNKYSLILDGDFSHVCSVLDKIFSESFNDYDESNVPKFKPSSQNFKRRHIGRISVREGESSVANVKFNFEHGVDTMAARIYDISTTGMALVLPKSSVEDKNLVGIEGEVTFHLNSGNIFTEKFVCSSVADFKGDNVKLGMVFRLDDDHDAIEKIGLKTPEEKSLKGIIYKEHLYKERCQFYVHRVSGSNLVIRIMDSDPLVFKTMNVELGLYFESKDAGKVSGVVESVSKVDRNCIQVNVGITRKPEGFDDNLIMYFTQNFSWTPDFIRSAGFEVNKISDTMKFRFVETHEDYLEVLKLRHFAYSEAQKIPVDTPLDKMVAPLDHKSRIIMVLHHGRLIASKALTFPDSENLVLDTERALEGGFPKSIPPKTELVEVSRMCIHPDYRKSDLAIRIFQHSVKTFATAKRKYILTSADDRTWKVYKHIGFKKTGAAYDHPDFKGITHHLILARVDSGTKAKGFSIFKWAFFYSDVAFYLEQAQITKIGPVKRLLLKMADKTVRWYMKITGREL